MPFTAKPIVGGDAFDQACEIGRAADAELALLADAADQAACLRRHWDAIIGLGWTTTAIPEDAGGAGGDISDLAALVGGAGRGGLPLPIATSCGVLPHLLVEHAEVLTALAEGRARIALVPAEAAIDNAAAAPQLADGRLTGTVVGIETPPDPTHALLVVGDALLLVPAGATGVGVTRYQRIDGRPSADWRFVGVAVDPAWILAHGEGVTHRAAAARDLGALLTCIESVSAAGALIEQTIEYLLNRVQFGVPLATHQALRHRVAEMYVEYETLRGLAAQALRSVGAGDPGAWRDIAFAKLRLGEGGRFIAQSTIQCHGGMGMTEGLQAIRLARRIMMAEFEYGDRSVQARRLLDDAARRAA
ncbi:acyl-CoA dehydrogenase family protein [Roseomonas sp. HJA6]|uniref:Acyl-CoA dehydrogenase family protein n=1 Tax=Roseomonas alba TaxID=2846776 RepID=A0ABS7AET6_9PROT|nr:acyl-CoA dehydrogenase family protein [Neoroseomonas alba]MBW6400673.1 acyl-CoA dehydrogenase family protein [Neoroseomonas alba]